jgi:hypothetical protein
MTTWFAVVPAHRKKHLSREPGPGYAIVDGDGQLASAGRLLLAADDTRHWRLDLDRFARRIAELRQSDEVCIVLERHVRAPHECAQPFAAGREVGQIEGFAEGSGVPLLRFPFEEWRDAMVPNGRLNDYAEKAEAIARARWPAAIGAGELSLASVEAALLAAFARETRKAKAR